MSNQTAIPVSFTHHELITKGVIDHAGSKGSYVKTFNDNVTLVMLPAHDVVVVPSAYEKPLRVLSYRYELQKCTIPKVAKSKHACKTLLQDLLYLDRVRERFVQEVRVVPENALQHWRCGAFEYHLWLDYMYGKHDDEARKLLEGQHGVTFKAITLKKSGSDILKLLDWTMYKRRYCKKIDLCGLEYPLESTIGKDEPPAAKKWAQLILAGLSSIDRGVIVQGETHTDIRDLTTIDQRLQRKDEEGAQPQGTGESKIEVEMENETELRREQKIEQSAKNTSSASEIAIKHLQMLLFDNDLIDSEIPCGQLGDELLGLCMFKNALVNYPEKPHLLEDFFQLAGSAARTRSKDPHRVQLPVSVMHVHMQKDSDTMHQPRFSKLLPDHPSPTVVRGHCAEQSTMTGISHKLQFENEGLLKAWRKYRKL